MKAEDIGSVPICEDRHSKKLVGIVTDRDLALYVVAEGRDANSTPVEQVMSRGPITCGVGDDLQKALDAMQRSQVRRIPVVDDGGQLVGMIALADVAIRGEQPDKTAELVEGISKPSSMHAA